MTEQKYQYNGTIPQWIPGVGVVTPGQTFVSRYPMQGNPQIILSSEPATGVGELSADDKVCKECVRVKSKDNKAKKKE